MDTIDTRVLYEFTATLRPIWYKHKPEKQYDLLRKAFDEHLMKYDITAVAELTKTYNIHMHAAIRLSPTQYRQFTDTLRVPKLQALFGKCTFNQVQYDQSYYEYMKKDIVITLKVINEIPILADKLQVLSVKPINVYLQDEQ